MSRFRLCIVGVNIEEMTLCPSPVRCHAVLIHPTTNPKFDHVVSATLLCKNTLSFMMNKYFVENYFETIQISHSP